MSSTILHLLLIIQSPFPTAAPGSAFVSLSLVGVDFVEAPKPILLLPVSLVLSSLQAKSHPAYPMPPSLACFLPLLSSLSKSLPFQHLEAFRLFPIRNPPSVILFHTSDPSPLASPSTFVSVPNPHSHTRLTSSTPLLSLLFPCPSPFPRAVCAPPPQRCRS